MRVSFHLNVDSQVIGNEKLILTTMYISEYIFLYFSLGAVTGQFTAASQTCPGDSFTFQCTVTGNISGLTIWRVGGRNECALVHTTTTPICGPTNFFTARSKTGFGTSDATFFTSTLSGTANPALNGTLVECFGPNNNVDPGNLVGGSTLQIRGQ